MQVGFALLHWAQRYSWRAIGVFVAAGLVISNILENLSIRTGFPYGHYHYAGANKFFQVPWFIGPTYRATGYLAWVVATVLLGDVRRHWTWLTTHRYPHHRRVRHHRLGPRLRPHDLDYQPHLDLGKRWRVLRRSPRQLLGWTFALYLRGRGPLPAEPRDQARASDLQGVLAYAATTISYFTKYFTAKRTTVIDAVGATWRGDIYETSALLTVDGMVFIALLALLRIAQQRTTAAAFEPEVDTIQRAEPEPGTAIRIARRRPRRGRLQGLRRAGVPACETSRR